MLFGQSPIFYITMMLGTNCRSDPVYIHFGLPLTMRTIQLYNVEETTVKENNKLKTGIFSGSFNPVNIPPTV